MHRIVDVKTLADYKLWLKFADGVEGVVDLSDLVGKGVFSQWQDKKFFDSVYIDRESHTITWPGGIDLCPDELYAEITGEDINSILKAKATAV
ncbi:MAG: DUF2442 domain-containing protein [candidate division WOR-3 bacterium]